MDKRYIEYKEGIEMFVNATLPFIKAENEIPDINFIFDDKSLSLIEEVYKNPFKLKGSRTPNISRKDLRYLDIKNNSNPSSPTIVINDGEKFFKYLVDISNAFIDLCDDYNDTILRRSAFLYSSRRVFLRMTYSDLNDIESFLSRQIEFYKNRELYEYSKQKCIKKYDEYYIYAYDLSNATYEESTRSMHFFAIHDNVHDLPKIDYDIDDSKNCYLLAVQHKNGSSRDKKFERKIYTLNKKIENCNVHPNQVYALMLFLSVLKSHDIHIIKVPKNNVLNYRYHVILSETIKDKFAYLYDGIDVSSLKGSRKKDYETDLEYYNHLVSKEDYIEYIKFKRFFDLINRVTIHDKDFNLDHEEDDYLVYTLK